MVPRTIDLVAAGPPSEDIYDPAAPAWALAAGLSGRGHSVQVVYPGTPNGVPVPPGVTAVAFSGVTEHVGTFRGDAEIAHLAGRHLRRQVEVVVRDPAGFGPIGHHARSARIVAFVRSLSTASLAPEPASPTSGGFRSKLAWWGERRDARHLEKEALREASVVYCSTSAMRESLHRTYGLLPGRLHIAPTAVAEGPEPISREAARRKLGVPDDVAVVAVLPIGGVATAESLAPSLEAFVRLRKLYPGSRLAVVGAPSVTAPGAIAVPDSRRPTVAAVCAGADVGLIVGQGAEAEGALVLGLRAGLSFVAPPALDLGEMFVGAVRRADTGDPAELAAALVGLIADTSERKELAEKGRKLAERFLPARVAEELERATGLLAG
jgi:Glycosyltransferase Family 4